MLQDLEKIEEVIELQSLEIKGINELTRKLIRFVFNLEEEMINFASRVLCTNNNNNNYNNIQSLEFTFSESDLDK